LKVKLFLKNVVSSADHEDPIPLTKLPSNDDITQLDGIHNSSGQCRKRKSQAALIC